MNDRGFMLENAKKQVLEHEVDETIVGSFIVLPRDLKGYNAVDKRNTLSEKGEGDASDIPGIMKFREARVNGINPNGIHEFTDTVDLDDNYEIYYIPAELYVIGEIVDWNMSKRLDIISNDESKTSFIAVYPERGQDYIMGVSTGALKKIRGEN